MDAKDLRTEAALGDRNKDGTASYTQSGSAVERPRTYQNAGSSPMGKAEAASARPCAVIGPDRVVPSSTARRPPDHWPADPYRQPPGYPHQPIDYHHTTRNISPRQTFQENMQRIMVPPSYTAPKLKEDHNFQLDPDNSSPVRSNKINVSTETKYCDVPYPIMPTVRDTKNMKVTDVGVHKTVVSMDTKYSDVNYPSNPIVSDTKSVRTSEAGVPHSSSVLTRNAQGWPPAVAQGQPSKQYSASELFQYPEYQSCAAPRPMFMNRPHRTVQEIAGMPGESYYHDGNVRFKPYPSPKERYPQARYDFVGNYPNPMHAPPFPTHKTLPSNPYPGYPQVPLKYMDTRMSDTLMNAYQRPPNPQAAYSNISFRNPVIHPSYGPIQGNCLQSNKFYPYPDTTTKTMASSKLPPYPDYDAARSKAYPVPEGFYVNDITRPHVMKSQVLPPNYPNPNMHMMHTHPYYRKDNVPIKNYDHSGVSDHYRTIDPSINLNNSPLPRFTTQFPNAVPMAHSDLITNNTANVQQPNVHHFPEEFGYISQSASTRSFHSGISRFHNDPFRRYDYSNYGPVVKPSVQSNSDLNIVNNNQSSKDKKDIDVRQFLQMWNEGEEESSENNTKDKTVTIATGVGTQGTVSHSTNQEQLYVMGIVNVPSEELDKYEHIQKVSKLPENIKGYNSIEILHKFEAVIESSNLNNHKPGAPSTRDFRGPLKNSMPFHPMQTTAMPHRPLSPLDVEAKISQSVIHKDVGCNFEIKPCSPKMLNVESATPVQNAISERIIEKVTNPVVVLTSTLHTSVDNVNVNNIVKCGDQSLPQNETNIKSPCCVMTGNSYSNLNIDAIAKPNYIFQDLESNSGVCLASLPRLDNDIELSFPEVNQQFINANKIESSVITSTPAQELPLIDNDVKTKNSIEHESDSKFDPKTKKNTNYKKFKKRQAENALSSMEPKSQHIRTDSVIIKNPDTYKNVEEDSPKPYAGENSQKVPINLTKNTEHYASSVDDGLSKNVCDELAIDFSLNSNDRDTEYGQTQSVVFNESEISPDYQTVENDNDLAHNLKFDSQRNDYNCVAYPNCTPDKHEGSMKFEKNSHVVELGDESNHTPFNFNDEVTEWNAKKVNIQKDSSDIVKLDGSVISNDNTKAQESKCIEKNELVKENSELQHISFFNDANDDEDSHNSCNNPKEINETLSQNVEADEHDNLYEKDVHKRYTTFTECDMDTNKHEENHLNVEFEKDCTKSEQYSLENAPLRSSNSPIECDITISPSILREASCGKVETQEDHERSKTKSYELTSTRNHLGDGSLNDSLDKDVDKQKTTFTEYDGYTEEQDEELSQNGEQGKGNIESKQLLLDSDNQPFRSPCHFSIERDLTISPSIIKVTNQCVEVKSHESSVRLKSNIDELISTRQYNECGSFNDSLHHRTGCDSDSYKTKVNEICSKKVSTSGLSTIDVDMLGDSENIFLEQPLTPMDITPESSLNNDEADDCFLRDETEKFDAESYVKSFDDFDAQVEHATILRVSNFSKELFSPWMRKLMLRVDDCYSKPQKDFLFQKEMTPENNLEKGAKFSEYLKNKDVQLVQDSLKSTINIIYPDPTKDDGNDDDDSEVELNGKSNHLAIDFITESLEKVDDATSGDNKTLEKQSFLPQEPASEEKVAFTNVNTMNTEGYLETMHLTAMSFEKEKTINRKEVIDSDTTMNPFKFESNILPVKSPAERVNTKHVVESENSVLEEESITDITHVPQSENSANEESIIDKTHVSESENSALEEESIVDITHISESEISALEDESVVDITHVSESVNPAPEEESIVDKTHVSESENSALEKESIDITHVSEFENSALEEESVVNTMHVSQSENSALEEEYIVNTAHVSESENVAPEEKSTVDVTHISESENSAPEKESIIDLTHISESEISDLEEDSPVLVRCNLKSSDINSGTIGHFSNEKTVLIEKILEQCNVETVESEPHFINSIDEPLRPTDKPPRQNALSDKITVNMAPKNCLDAIRNEYASDSEESVNYDQVERIKLVSYASDSDEISENNVSYKEQGKCNYLRINKKSDESITVDGTCSKPELDKIVIDSQTRSSFEMNTGDYLKNLNEVNAEEKLEGFEFGRNNLLNKSQKEIVDSQKVNIVNEIDVCLQTKTHDSTHEDNSQHNSFDTTVKLSKINIVESSDIEFGHDRDSSLQSHLSSTKKTISLKRSMSESNLTNLMKHSETETTSVWPNKRKKLADADEKLDPQMIEDSCSSAIQNSRRNSLSSICKENNVSYCIFIDNGCLLPENCSETEKIKCITEIAEDYLTCVQNDPIVGGIDSSAEIVSFVEEMNEYSSSYPVEDDNGDENIEEPWVDDVACVETVGSEDIAEDIIIDASTSLGELPNPEYDEGESGILNINDHSDKVKYIYGDKMCSNDAQLLETLYRTPQMNVNKKLVNRESHNTYECGRYYDRESLEKVLSESSSYPEVIYEPEGVAFNTSSLYSPGLEVLENDKENIDLDTFSDPPTPFVCKENNFISNEDVSETRKCEETQDDTVHSCESSIDNVFSYIQKEDSPKCIISSSPEVSSTTSEEKNSSILLKITNLRSARAPNASAEDIHNTISCKYTETNDYLNTDIRIPSRPLITKAAQKYIPPLKETMPNLKVKLPLPQHSLVRLKQMKVTKETHSLSIEVENRPKLNLDSIAKVVNIPNMKDVVNVQSRPKVVSHLRKDIPKKEKPKFEDVLKSIEDIQIQMHKEKSKKGKKAVPKVVIKKTRNGSHYASTTPAPDLTGRKWQPWVFLEKNPFIDKMAIEGKTRAVYNHRQKAYVLMETFKKYKSINHTKFVILSKPKFEESSSGRLKYTIRLKHG